MAKKKTRTPGPWHYGGPVTRDAPAVQKHPPVREKFWEIGSQSQGAYGMVAPGIAAVNSEADAMLVAAAPELLDLCNKAADYILATISGTQPVSYGPDLHMAIKEVIRKATGT